MSVTVNNWQKIWNEWAQAWKTKTLCNLFLQDPHRAERYFLTVGELSLDYSKNFIDDALLASWRAMLEQVDLKKAIERLFEGEKINVTENRSVLHTKLREEKPGQAFEVAREQLSKMVHRLYSEDWRGITGKSIRRIVNLGIGGSDLGPRMVVQALSFYRQKDWVIDFVSNVDPVAITEVLNESDPASTLFIISSKSFTTPETLWNAQIAKKWLVDHLGERAPAAHFMAVTAKPEKARAWGIPEDNILSFDEGIGGRYSVWSAIGISVALSIGMENFNAFLAGARAMDEHFRTAPYEANMPVLLALIGCWYIHGWGAHTHAVLPYAHGLRAFPDYLQQLDMESNGKSVQVTGKPVEDHTGPIVWGQAGTNGQHAFYQLLHQGTHFIPIDFIFPATSSTDAVEQHQQFIANVLAQAQALMQGDKGCLPHDNMPGNRPSNMIILKQLTPFSLGELLALYEHKIYVQGVLWGINSFDQPGVELGKKLAKNVFSALQTGNIDTAIDLSTQHLIRILQNND